MTMIRIPSTCETAHQIPSKNEALGISLQLRSHERPEELDGQRRATRLGSHVREETLQIVAEVDVPVENHRRDAAGVPDVFERVAVE